MRRGELGVGHVHETVGFCSSVAVPTSPAAAFEEAPVPDPSPGRSRPGAAAPNPGRGTHQYLDRSSRRGWA